MNFELLDSRLETEKESPSQHQDLMIVRTPTSRIQWKELKKEGNV
jgi:hypothetical protein